MRGKVKPSKTIDERPKMEKRIEFILDILGKISNINFQNEVWIQGKYWDRVSSFGESVNLLDDYGFFDDFKLFEKLLDEVEREKMAYFKELLLAYEQNGNNILHNEEWLLITRLAQELVQIIKPLLKI